MEIRDIRPSEIEPARRLLEASGWTRRVSDPADFRELLSRSQRAIVAVEGGEVIGFLRALYRWDGERLHFDAGRRGGSPT